MSRRLNVLLFAFGSWPALFVCDSVVAARPGTTSPAAFNHPTTQILDKVGSRRGVPPTQHPCSTDPGRRRDRAGNERRGPTSLLSVFLQSGRFEMPYWRWGHRGIQRGGVATAAGIRGISVMLGDS